MDSTAAILDDAAREYPWLIVHHLHREVRREPGGENVINRFLTPELWRDCDAILRIDADISFRPDFVELLLAEFARNPQLGIASGTLYEYKRGDWSEIRMPRFHTRGATKIYSVACLEAIGGLSSGLGWDTIDEVKAASLGFITSNFRHIRAFHHRPQGTAGGILRGRLTAGRAAYQTGYSPLFMVARTCRQALAWPPLIGSLWLMAGYVEGYVRRLPRTAPPELVRFVRRQQLRRLALMKSIWN